MNACTHSYSAAFWGWERWESEIDWMALQGINLPLALTGQEYVWMRVLRRYGLLEAELADFFAGPAFLAWGRMGNIQGWGGPLPVSFMERQAALQRCILERMRSLGMHPVLPGFAGFVPAALARRLPGGNYTRASRWAGFPEPFCCPLMLDPRDPLFQELGAAFIREQLWGREEGGGPSYYTADVFNEMRPSSADPAYLASVSAAVFKAMAAADPSATWIMQGWLFFSEADFWGPAEIKAFLGGVPSGRLILLDLIAEAHPQWNSTDSFYGAPFIWCMLHNFGGNTDMYGALPAVVGGFQQALASGRSLVGVGTAPEGIEQNPVVYDLANELAFRQEAPDLGEWFDSYVRRRYGLAAPEEARQAWQLLMSSVYNCSDGHGNTVKDVPTSRPGLSTGEAGPWALQPHLWYDPAQPLRAWRLLAAAGAALGGNAGYCYDLVDLGRNVLSKHSTQYWLDIVAGYLSRDTARVAGAGAQLLGLLRDMEALATTNRGFILGPRLAEARAAGTSAGEGAPSSEEADLCERNLRLQLTQWGAGQGVEGDSEIHDYANKEWAGLVGGYYRERWAQWVARLLTDLAEGRPYDASAWRAHTVAHAHAWAQEVGNPFPLGPVGDPVALSLALLDKYLPLEQAGAAAAGTGEADAAATGEETVQAVALGAARGGDGVPLVMSSGGGQEQGAEL